MSGQPARSEIEIRFTYHQPPDARTVKKYEVLRAHARAFADLIVASCPESREQSLAITKLEECVMWANAGIARAPAVYRSLKQFMERTDEEG